MTSNNTAISFKNKWEKNPNLAFSETLNEASDIFNWILQRNGFANGRDLQTYLANKQRILDAGCGNGRVTAMLQKYASPAAQIIGIDLVSANIARANLSGVPNVSIQTKDLCDDLSELGKFDFIYCQEVLHHTQSPTLAFHQLCQLLNPHGEIAIYVYKQKSPSREFVDDYIRDKIANLPYEEALKVCTQITKLGQSLNALNVTVKVDEVAVLDIPSGEYDIQRFIYHFFMKCFYNPNLSFHDNVIINYDWYHPQTATRHTLSEIKAWFKNENLHIVHEYTDFYGITIRGIKQG